MVGSTFWLPEFESLSCMIWGKWLKLYGLPCFFLYVFNGNKKIYLAFGVNTKYCNQFSRSVVSDSLWPHGLQHSRILCPSPTPGACSNSCASSWWCHPTISSSVIPFSSCLQPFPVSGTFPMSQLFASDGQGIGASASVLPMNIQDWFPLGWTGWNPCSPRDSQESSPTPQFKSINSLALSLLHSPTLTSIHDHWKNRSFDLDLSWESDASAF